ncbi:glutathione S-transferase N-terminal domain-containing protein [Herbaspirillum sp. YR522]|uniref:glutathione S-transferase N-terminal domain-containing protein n=1 Tax=Herbaspirillum sp. YR522 TaxID=1144342 RepID=UPI00026FBC5F|nr:glutathione S-transferase N-terminal domain-containing protein [Herbaspirillum sp. YR522]EJN02707.1 glutathione S-transferase [Herbaspirillum sp. YR522]
MKLLYSTSSPFVRKITILIHELGLNDRVERLPSAANPLQRDERITRYNPLGKVPVLVTDNATALFDSRVIADYLCSLVPGNALLPAQGDARWVILRNQALADGLLDAALLVRYEIGPRPEAHRWSGWVEAQSAKITAALDMLEHEAAAWAGRFDLAILAAGCALAYLDLRLAELEWRTRCPVLAQVMAPVLARDAFAQTVPVLPAPVAPAIARP